MAVAKLSVVVSAVALAAGCSATVSADYFEVASVYSYRVQESNSPRWSDRTTSSRPRKRAWVVTLRNNSSTALVCDVSVEWRDWDGFIVDDDIESSVPLAPHAVISVRGYHLIDAKAKPIWRTNAVVNCRLAKVSDANETGAARRRDPRETAAGSATMKGMPVLSESDEMGALYSDPRVQEVLRRVNILNSRDPLRDHPHFQALLHKYDQTANR